MSDFPYLIAIALIEEDGQRAMPIGGRALKEAESIEDKPPKQADNISFELLLRVFKRTQLKPLSTNKDGFNFFVIQISIQEMQDKIPLIKAEWIDSGEKNNLIQSLTNVASGIWAIDFVRYEGIKYIKINSSQS